MQGGRGPGLGELARRMSALERDLEDLRELVDGQESWSHRKRLHTVESSLRAEELVHQAIEELRNNRRGRWDRIREWSGFAIAAAALAIALLVKVHGG